jgi:serine protease Do
MKRFLLLVALVIGVFLIGRGSASAKSASTTSSANQGQQNVVVSGEENIITSVVKKSVPSIVTSKHAVSDQLNYSVITNDGKTYPVENIYKDSSNDLAVLKINASNLVPLSLGDSSNLQLGQTVIAIGTQLGEFPNTVTSGIISGLGRGITAGSPFSGYVEKLDNLIQIDAPINPGSSGGPLLNSSGQVVGVNTAMDVSGQDIGFAIPINTTKSMLSNFTS